MTNIDPSQIVGRQCKFATYFKSRNRQSNGVQDDMVFVKETIHLKDGTTVPSKKLLFNFERPFWITKPGHQNHEEKKEWEDIDKLQKFTSTQANLPNAIMKALGRYGPNRGLRQICSNPYVYGADISSTALIKRRYMDKWPEYNDEYNVAVLDAETDVVHGHGDPVYLAITFKDKAILAATKEFVGGIDDFEVKMKDYFYKRVPDLASERKIDLEVKLCADPLELIKCVIAKAHEWMPDFLAVWNIDFDIPKLLATIEKYGGDADEIFSDPDVPKEFHSAWYKEGRRKKIAASGREEALHWADQWHTFYAPATFYLVDQAAVFRKLRVAKGKEPSMALDAILKKYTKVKKLKNEKADSMGGLEWHIYMQKHEKLEYGVYNLMDCIACEILDEEKKVGDLRLSIGMQCGHSDFEIFPSQPKRTVDDLYFECLEMGKVIATMSPEIVTEFDKATTTRYGWIVTLPAHLIENNGIKYVEELPDYSTLVRVGVYD